MPEAIKTALSYHAKHLYILSVLLPAKKRKHLFYKYFIQWNVMIIYLQELLDPISLLSFTANLRQQQVDNEIIILTK